MRTVLFLYWGRRGAGGRLLLDLALAAQRDPRNKVIVSVSRSAELFDEFRVFGPRLHVARTFDRALGSLSLRRIVALRNEIREIIREEEVNAVVTVMSHVWSPAIAPIFRRAKVPYAVIVHDGVPHPGDRTGSLNRWLFRDARQANIVVTLSHHVEQLLLNRGGTQRIICLFHPHLSHGVSSTTHDKVRFLFFGRIMPYKGLALFVAALERLKTEGHAFEAGVFGEGDLRPVEARLRHLGVEVVNRWIAESEIAGIFSRFDVTVASHVEASQSGVVSVSLGNGVPVIATPVGGMVEQISDGRTGLLSTAVSSEALANCMRRIITEDGFLTHLKESARTNDDYSARDFSNRLLAAFGHDYAE